MSTENTSLDNEQDETLKSMEIAQLRKYAAIARVAITRDMDKNEIITAIKAKQRDRDTIRIAEVGNAPAPGWTRIVLHRNGSPGALNRPLYINANGYKCTVPVGVEVDVPHKVVEVLNNSIEMRKEPDTEKRDRYGLVAYKDVPVHCYPFQTIASTPGPDPRPGREKTEASRYGPRYKFMQMFGRWPKRAELLEAIKEGLIRLDSSDTLSGREFKKEE